MHRGKFPRRQVFPASTVHRSLGTVAGGDRLPSILITFCGSAAIQPHPSGSKDREMTQELRPEPPGLEGYTSKYPGTASRCGRPPRPAWSPSLHANARENRDLDLDSNSCLRLECVFRQAGGDNATYRLPNMVEASSEMVPTWSCPQFGVIRKI